MQYKSHEGYLRIHKISNTYERLFEIPDWQDDFPKYIFFWPEFGPSESMASLDLHPFPRDRKNTQRVLARNQFLL